MATAFSAKIVEIQISYLKMSVNKVKVLTRLLPSWHAKDLGDLCPDLTYVQLHTLQYPPIFVFTVAPSNATPLVIISFNIFWTIRMTWCPQRERVGCEWVLEVTWKYSPFHGIWFTMATRSWDPLRKLRGLVNIVMFLYEKWQYSNV